MTPFQGLSAFPVTPLDADGAVAPDRLARLVARIAKTGAASIGVLGSTGSYAYLGSDARARALEVAIGAAGGTPVLAGIGALATRDVVRHARDAEAAGAAGLLLAPVSYLPLTDDEVFGLFADASEATDLPICVYNNPTTTGFTVSEALLARLGTIPGVVAVKNPAPVDGDFGAGIARLRAALPADFSLGQSGDAAIAAALSAPLDAFYSVFAGTFPETGAALWAARSDPAALGALDARLAPLWAVFRRHGGIRVVHEAVEMLGLGPAIPPRPLRPLDADARRDLRGALLAAGLLESRAA